MSKHDHKGQERPRRERRRRRALSGIPPNLGPTRAREAACLNLVLNLTAHAFDTTRAQILAPHRGRQWVSEARQVAIYLSNTICQVKLMDIAEWFGRDRTTVTYAMHRIEDRRDDPWFNVQLERLEDRLRAKMFELDLEVAGYPTMTRVKGQKTANGDDVPETIILRSARGRVMTYRPVDFSAQKKS